MAGMGRDDKLDVVLYSLTNTANIDMMSSM
jgi:hypothetical protein